MKSIQYAGESYITGDNIADAVIRYAQALARADTSAPIDIPVVGPDGGFTSTTLLLGPASQLAAMHIEGHQDEPAERELLREIEQKIIALMGAEALPADAASQDGSGYYDEF